MKPRRSDIPPERDRVEWKESLGEWKEIIETCAAFATARGGTIYVGVASDGSTKGIQVGKGTLEDCTLRIIRACEGSNIRVEFSIQAGSFVVRLLKKLPLITEGVGKRVGEPLSANPQGQGCIRAFVRAAGIWDGERNCLTCLATGGYRE